MLIGKEIKVKITRGNIGHYSKFGYDLKIGMNLLFPIEKLSKKSRMKVKVSCDICHTEKDVEYYRYLRSHNNYGFDTCIRCVYSKVRMTNLKKYGSGTPAGNKDILNKIMKTNNDRYGGNAPCCSEKVLTKQRKTRIERKLENPLYIQTATKLDIYKRRVYTLTNRKEFLEKWDGYDYYDNEYIKDNLKLDCRNRLYPTIDHIISISYGFYNGIDAKEIAKSDNLAITKRWINCSRGNRDSRLFRESFNEII